MTPVSPRTFLSIFTLSALAWGGGCEGTFEVGDDGYVLPATLDEVLPAAQGIATDWEESAFVWGMGGGFTITDENGVGYNHSYRFYSLRNERILDLHLFGGTHWADETPRPRQDAPAPLEDVIEDWDTRLSAQEAIQIAIDAASDSINPIVWEAFGEPEELSARLLSHPVWPERPTAGAITDSLAWRVDFVGQKRANDGTPQWWSFVRIYLHPVTGEVFEVIDRLPEGELYPNL